MKWLRLFIIIAGVLAMQIKLPDLFREYDALLQNTFYAIRGEIKPDDNIIIAAINDAAILEYGDWPWSRRQIAALIDSISDCSPKAIYLNFYFRKKPNDTDNAILAQSIRNAGNVVIPFTFEKLQNHESVAVTEAPSPSVQKTALMNTGKNIPTDIIQARILHEPEPDFTEAAAALGFNNSLSSYGFSRYTLQTINFGNHYYPSVSLAIAAVSNNSQTNEFSLIPNEAIHGTNNLSVAIDNYATSMINFCGGEKSFPHISVSEMLGRNFNKSTLKDRIVFVGLTDKRNSDQQRTPYTSKLSSTELWATITANTLSSPPFIRFHLIILSLIIPVLVIIGVGFLTEFVISMPYKKGTTITLVGAGALVVVSFVIFAAGYWISLLLPILYLAGLAIWLTYRRIKYGIPQTIKLDDIEYDTNGSLKRIGRYVIEKEIGSGSMGTVYKAIDPKINRVVAVKIIKLGGVLDSQKELRERFAREARAAGGLAHPSIVTVHDFGETKALAYMVMEFIEGESLEEKLAKLKKIAPAETVRIINCVADGLQKAHEQGIIHRDIKPSNIMTMKDTNEVKLMDFGVAKITGNLTDTGKTLGTPFYMSPEQLNGEEIDSRTDVFALAVTAYECLSGVRPFAGDNLSALTYSILHKNPASISEKNPDIPASADSVFAKALAKERDNRYPDATAFAKALTTALSK